MSDVLVEAGQAKYVIAQQDSNRLDAMVRGKEGEGWTRSSPDFEGEVRGAELVLWVHFSAADPAREPNTLRAGVSIFADWTQVAGPAPVPICAACSGRGWNEHCSRCGELVNYCGCGYQMGHRTPCEACGGSGKA
jgi:hypothetical protein